MKRTNLPLGIQDFISRCPRAGNGVNVWVFRLALILHRSGVPECEMPALIAEATQHCGRVVTELEIERAIVNSGNSLRTGSTAEYRTPKWPAANPEQIEAVMHQGIGLGGLRELSPVKWKDGQPHAEEIIDLLFPGNPLLCVGQSKFKFNTMPRQVWRGLLAQREFIVPSPMTKVAGVTKDGKASKHTLDNTGPRRFLVVEFDNGTFDQHAAILVHLSGYAPLVLAVHSGSKSLHGWFFVQNIPESGVERFFRYAVSLGADRQLWIRSQFVRMPFGWRSEKQKRQEVVYFNPSLIYA